ncbi:MAG: XTP/dITP diphosphatase [Eubacteriales bacterium]|nr:XTP/dITP diphosphatase [Eubacteriales bacterium]
MKKLIIATNNEGKAGEIKAILGGFYDEILSLKDAGLTLDVIEDGQSFEENAIKKAKEAARLSGCDTLADDSGLCVDALGGAPGIYSARYAGEGAADDENNDKLLREMAGKTDRRAKFVCAMALASGGGILTARGEVCGVITGEKSGQGGFGYDPLFFVSEYGQTMAQLPADVKNSISHRSRALLALKQKLTEQ